MNEQMVQFVMWHKGVTRLEDLEDVEEQLEYQEEQMKRYLLAHAARRRPLQW
jgi:hypothetical protein